MRRAFADTKMTGCALLLEVFPTDRPRRSDRIFLFVCLLTFQACYRFLGLGDEFGGCSGSNTIKLMIAFRADKAVVEDLLSGLLKKEFVV